MKPLKHFTPSDVIAGYFMKQRFIRIPEIREYQKAQTIVVNFGESGERSSSRRLRRNTPEEELLD